tara:strand:+ start:1724 stop:2764 length:1041 start_codon:yes stop_codon:yes gene_type:complete
MDDINKENYNYLLNNLVFLEYLDTLNNNEEKNDFFQCFLNMEYNLDFKYFTKDDYLNFFMKSLNINFNLLRVVSLEEIKKFTEQYNNAHKKCINFDNDKLIIFSSLSYVIIIPLLFYLLYKKKISFINFIIILVSTIITIVFSTFYHDCEKLRTKYYTRKKNNASNKKCDFIKSNLKTIQSLDHIFAFNLIFVILLNGINFNYKIKILFFIYYLIYNIILCYSIFKDEHNENDENDEKKKKFTKKIIKKLLLQLLPTLIISLFYIYINYITLIIPKKYGLLKLAKMHKFTNNLKNIIFNLIGFIFGIIGLLFYFEVINLNNKLIVHSLWHILGSISSFFLVLSHNI